MKRVEAALTSIGALAFTMNAVAFSDVEVVQHLAVVAQELSPQLPLGTASAKIVSTEVGPGRKFTYVIASRLRANEWTEVQKARHREVKRVLYCSDPDMKFFRDRGVTVVFAVIDENGTPVDEAATAPKDCK
jgi:hypothetical protein